MSRVLQAIEANHDTRVLSRVSGTKKDTMRVLIGTCCPVSSLCQVTLSVSRKGSKRVTRSTSIRISRKANRRAPGTASAR